MPIENWHKGGCFSPRDHINCFHAMGVEPHPPSAGNHSASKHTKGKQK